MTEFRRLISYIYEYEGKVKGKNVGFAKLETRNGLCKFNVSVKKLYMGSGSLGVYLLSARQEIFLGNMYLRNGSGEFRTVVQAADIEQSGETMDDCYGLTIHEKKDSWKVYTTIWEDSAAQAAQLASAPVELEEVDTAEDAGTIPVCAVKPAQNEGKNEETGDTDEALKKINTVTETVSEKDDSLSENQAENKPEFQPEIPLENKSEIQPENKPEIQPEDKPETTEESSQVSQPGNKEKPDIPAAGHTEAPAQSPGHNRPSGSRMNHPSRRSQGQMFFNLRQPSAQVPPSVLHTNPSSSTGEPAFRPQPPLPANLETPQPLIRQQEEEPLIVGDPEALAKLEEEEKMPMVPLWDFLSKTYPKIQAFESQYGCEILVIKPQDIGLLPREIWIYGNNSFLLHGYYNYRYLILARLENPNGLPRYLLGIPGHYYSNEKYMASMFGFPNFVLSKKQQAQDGRFGYWYTDVRLGDGNVAPAVLRQPPKR